MMFTKEIHNKLEGRQYRHHIQSFKPGEVNPETAHKIAVEFAEKILKTLMFLYQLTLIKDTYITI